MCTKAQGVVEVAGLVVTQAARVSTLNWPVDLSGILQQASASFCPIDLLIQNLNVQTRQGQTDSPCQYPMAPCYHPRAPVEDLNIYLHCGLRYWQISSTGFQSMTRTASDLLQGSKRDARQLEGSAQQVGYTGILQRWQQFS